MRDLDVFVNCPFDANYKPIFYAMVFTVVRSGYRARCALETDDATDNRLSKIYAIIDECKFGIHDISCTETDGVPPVPRFNMPLELGIFLGAKRYGNKVQKGKVCIIFDREKHRYQKFISDIAGQDIHSHDGVPANLIAELANWLRSQPGGVHVGGAQAFIDEYTQFEQLLPVICNAQRLELKDLTFLDYVGLVTEYISTLTGTGSGKSENVAQLVTPPV